MAIVRRARNGDQTSSEYRDGKRSRKFTQVWNVELTPTDPDPISGIEVQSMRGLPIPGYSVYSPRPGFIMPFALCRTSVPTCRPNNRRFWTVTCTFELSGSDDEKPMPDETEPESLMPKIEPFVESAEMVMMEDFDGKKVIDVFGDLFEQPVMAPIPLRGVNVTRYVKEFDDTTLASWLQTTNDKPWRGEPEDAWCITEITGQKVEFGSFTIGQLNLKILSNPVELSVQLGAAAPAKRRIGWLEVRAARSTMFKDDNGERQVYRLNGSGSSPKMTWIDKEGKPSDVPYYQAFRTRRQNDFNKIA